MPTCFALFCTHDSRKDSCRMYQFPSNPDLRKQWLNNTRRTDKQLKSSSRICSCHFVNSKRQYGPTLFAWTNYISKLRRDLDSAKEVEHKPIAIVEDISAPGLEVEVKTVGNEEIEIGKVEVEVRTENEEDIDIENIVPVPGISLPPDQFNSDVATNSEDENNKTRTNSSTDIDIKEIDAKVNTDRRLVNLRVGNLIMKYDIDELEKKLNDSNQDEAYQFERLTIEKLKENETLLNCYTGLKSFSMFRYLIYVISEAEPCLKYNKWAVINLRLEEQLLIILMKLRCNFGFNDIAYRFRVSSSTVKNIIWTFVDGMHAILYLEAIANKPFPYFIGTSTALPEEFLNFSNCRIILGCIEVEAEASRHSSAANYKQRILRALVGVSPLGDFIFASELYPENVSLREIVKRSGLCEKLSPGDLILSLENLSISDLLPPNVDLNVPLLTHHDVTMNEKKILADITIATKCLNLAVEKLKRYAVLDRILLSYRGIASKTFQLCCALVNLESCVVEENYCKVRVKLF